MLFGKKSGIKNRNREKYERVRRLMWIKCESCGKLVYYKDYKDNKYICPSCGRAFIMTPKQRFDLLFDDNSWVRLTPPTVSDDPLHFTDRVSYTDRLIEARAETGCYDAVEKRPQNGRNSCKNFSFSSYSFPQKTPKGVFFV